MTKVTVVVSHPIQHFCPQYASWAQLGGIELKVIFASKHGLVPYEDRNFGRTIQWSGIRLDFPHEFLPNADKRSLGLKIDSPDLDAILSGNSPDVLVVYGYSQRLQRRATRWGEKNKVPLLMISDSELHSSRSVLKSAIKKLILPRIYRQTALFLTVGDANEAYYRHYGVRDSQLVRCFFPIDLILYDEVTSRSGEARSRIRRELGIPENHKVILNVGKFVSWKRQIDLVQFSNRLQGQRSDVTVIFAGAGPDETELKNATQLLGPGGVVFAGFVTPDVLAEYYCAADIYAHCSEHEPHSLAISEAIYCGLPVVISDRCGSYGPSDDLRNGLNGLVYGCGDVSELANKLLAILDQDDTRVQMSEASKQFAQRHQVLAHGEALQQALTILKLS